MSICLSNGLLTPSETLSPPAPSLTVATVKKPATTGSRQLHHINWQAVLRDATFHSLIKHTAFTPSLDEKIETDRLLWEKIQMARFLKKQGKIDDFEKVKTGVLVDTTRDRGYLEFRQSDRSVYNCDQAKCKPIIDRLLAIWRVQKLAPDQIWIRVKIPKYPLYEDVYQYTPTQGLKQMDTIYEVDADGQNEDTTRKHSDENDGIVLDELKLADKSSINRQDGKYYEYNDEMKNIFKKQSVRIYKPQPSYAVVPGSTARQSYLPYIFGVPVRMPPRPSVKSPTWPQRQAYYQPSVISEFQKSEKIYNGFIPNAGPTGHSIQPIAVVPAATIAGVPTGSSVGPTRRPIHSIAVVPVAPMSEVSTGSSNGPIVRPIQSIAAVPASIAGVPASSIAGVPHVYQPTIPRPIPAYDHYSSYIASRLQNAGLYYTSTTPKNFKPSTEFVRYSEPDPFYLDNSYAYTTPRTNDLNEYKNVPSTPASIIVHSNVHHYPTSINSQLLTFDKEKNTTVKITSPTTEKSAVFTSSMATAVTGQEIGQDEGQLSQPTNSVSNIGPNVQQTTTNVAEVKNIQKAPSIVSSSESYDGYAPLFIRWGEKLKPTLNKSPGNGNFKRKPFNSIAIRKEAIPVTASSIKVTETTAKPQTETKPNIQEETEKDSSENELEETTTTESSTNYSDDNKTELEIITTESNEPTTEELANTTNEESEESTTTEKEATTTDKQYINDTTDINDLRQETTNIIDQNISTKSSFNAGTTNLIIDIEDKSPEEVVNELTTIGVRNSTRIEGYPETSEPLFVNTGNSLQDLEPTLVTTVRDQRAGHTEPVSVVVNRISTSYSYKTANGKTIHLEPSVKSR